MHALVTLLHEKKELETASIVKTGFYNLASFDYSGEKRICDGSSPSIPSSSVSE